MSVKKIAILSAAIVIIVVSAFVVNKVFFSIEQIYWQEGAKQEYEFYYNNSLSLTSEIGSSRSDVEISGVLNFRIFSLKNNMVQAGIQFSPVTILFSGQKIESLEKIYSQFFTVEMKYTGEIINYTFPNSISNKDEIMIKDLLTNYILQMSEGGGKNWQVEQDNATGTYIAEFNKVKNGIFKKKLKYNVIKGNQKKGNLEIDTAENAEVEIQVTNTVFEYGKPASWIRNVRGAEQEKYQLRNETKVLSVTKYHLKEIFPQFNPAYEIWNNDLSYDSFVTYINLNETEKEPLSFWEKENKKYLEKKFANETNDSIFKDYFSKEKAEWDDKVFIRDYLKVHPEKALDIPYMLTSKNLTDDQQAGLIHILELADTPEAQEALIIIINNEKNIHMNRVRAIVALSGIDYPTVNMVQQLTEIYEKALTDKDEDISNTSMLTLGNLSSTLNSPELNKESIELSKKIKTKIEDEINNNTESNKSVLLLAIENTKDNELMPYAAKYITSDDPNIRSAAASVYRNMDDEAARTALIPAVTNEQNSAVREAMVNALREKNATEESFEKIHELAKGETSETVRRTMVRYLVENRDKAESEEVFKKMLETEESPETRTLLYKAIYSKGKLDKIK